MHYRKRDIIQNPKMCILTDNIISHRHYGAINKLIVIPILLYEAEMIIRLLTAHIRRMENHLNKTMGHQGGSLLHQDFLIFVQYFIRQAQDETSFQKCLPQDMIHAMPAQYLQQTIRIYHHPFLLHVHTL